MAKEETQPVGLYLHIPFCATKCPYCDFFSVRYSKTMVSSFQEAMLRNLSHIPSDWVIDSIYFGGGTPSLFPPPLLAQMLETIQSRCTLLHPEITLEANPCTMTRERLQQWWAMGIRRLSVGVQSFIDEELRLIGRNHTAKQAETAICSAATVGFENLSVDLMLGTPAQTTASCQTSVQTACALPITHISAYLLKLEERTPFGQHPPALPDEDAVANRYLALHEWLTTAGYVHYELSNFAKPGYESRHNCKYWRCLPYFGIGPSAHSCLKGCRFDTPDDLERFCAQPLQPMHIQTTEACQDAERLMLAFRLREGVQLSHYPACRTRLLANAKRIPSHLLEQTTSHIALTVEGWLVSNAVIGQLLDGIL